MACILVTGGAGYIGTHMCAALLRSGHRVIVVDNLCNGKAAALDRVERIAGASVEAFYCEDVRDRAAMSRIFARHKIDGVMHFAALKAVGESVQNPLPYYDNNFGGTVALAQVMAEAGVRRMVFSSSATVYGDPEAVPIRESAPTQPTNPYGWSKWMMEQVLRDVAAADPQWRIVVLRYFNPVGADESGLIGEDPNGEPSNLMPYISQVAIGRRDRLQVFGDDYGTADGTGVRDYIHVDDLVQGHLAALEGLDSLAPYSCLNLGTGRGYSVLEVIKAFERASGQKVPFRVVERRPGDVAACWADPTEAAAVLGWRARHGIERMCADAWRWQQGNPDGYV